MSDQVSSVPPGQGSPGVTSQQPAGGLAGPWMAEAPRVVLPPSAFQTPLCDSERLSQQDCARCHGDAARGLALPVPHCKLLLKKAF